MSKVTYNDDGTVSVELRRPIEVGSKKVGTIKLRTECTVEDLEAMDRGKGDVQRTKFLIAELTQISPSEPGLSAAAVGRMASSDYLTLAGVVGKILTGTDEEGESDPKGGPPETGAA